MPGAGLEPARDYSQGILSPLRLPISPPGPGASEIYFRKRPLTCTNPIAVPYSASVSRRTPRDARVLQVTGILP